MEQQGCSLLILGPARSGKTALLRDVAATLARERSVVVLDGDGHLGGSGYGDGA